MAASASGSVSGNPANGASIAKLVIDIGDDYKVPDIKSQRQIVQDIESKWQGEGVGARVRRSIGGSELRNLGELQRIPQEPLAC
jgi:hypothetical protein